MQPRQQSAAKNLDEVSSVKPQSRERRHLGTVMAEHMQTSTSNTLNAIDDNK